MTHAIHEHRPAPRAAEPVDAAPDGARSSFAAMPVPVPGLAMPADATIRRRVSVRGRHTGSESGATLEDPEPKAFDDDLEALIKIVDDTTSTAFAQVVNRPLFTGLEDLVAASGYLGLWVEKMTDAVDDGFAGSLSAAQFGYAIETLTTHLLGKAAAGWSLLYQVAAGSTRPDIVATKSGRTVWLDLTADSSHSIAHVYTSKSWHKRGVCPHEHAEIVYTPCTPDVMSHMLANGKLERAGKPKDAKVDAGALTAEIAAAQQRLKLARARWASEYGDKLKAQTKKVSEFSAVLSNREEHARISVYKWLNKTFALSLDTKTEHHGDADYAHYGISSMRRPREARKWKGSGGKARPVHESGAEQDPFAERRTIEKANQARRTEEAGLAKSILTAMSVDPTPHGFRGIGTASLARGIAFLTEQDEKAEAKKAEASEAAAAKDGEKPAPMSGVEMLG